MNRRALAVAIISSVWAGVVSGQRVSVSIDAGTARTRYADSIDASSMSVSPSLLVAGRRGSVAAFGSISQLGGSSTSSGTLDATLTAASRRGFAAELESVTGGSAHGDGSRTGQWLTLGRLRADASRGGVWAGAGLGRTWDGTWRDIKQADVGGWVSGASGSASVTVIPTAVDDSIAYTDARFVVHRPLNAIDVDASVGFRTGDQLPSLAANRRSWGSVAVTWRWRPGVGFVASAGTYPVDLTQGFPGGRFVSVSLRFEAKRPRETARAPLVPVAPRDGGLERFAAQRISGDQYVIRIRARNARTVELTGDPTGWSPVSLAREADGWWSVTVRLGQGVHELAARVDGGAWMAPPGLISATDEFGGVAGVLSIPK